MAGSAVSDKKAKREYAQLLRIHERVMKQLQIVRSELQTPSTHKIMKAIRQRTGSSPSEALGEVTTAVEEAIRACKMSESDLRQDLLENPGHVTVEGVDNLPAALSRFLAERSELPGFSYEVFQDENRGWIIRWKEHTEWGTVRGSGQFYERPYAWLED
ncbi:MAG: hypothetical protein V3T24_07965 [Longimicrobiales bacterium]